MPLVTGEQCLLCRCSSTEFSFLFSSPSSNGDHYDGDWVSGKRHGHGMLRCANGTIYDVSAYGSLCVYVCVFVYECVCVCVCVCVCGLARRAFLVLLI